MEIEVLKVLRLESSLQTEGALAIHLSLKAAAHHITRDYLSKFFLNGL